MKKYQSNIFRQTVAMLLMVLAVMCANVALAQTLTSREGNSVTNDVTTTKINISGTMSKGIYGLFDSDNKIIGSAWEYDPSWGGTLNVDRDVSLKEGDNVFKVFATDYYPSNPNGDPLATLTVTRSSVPAVSLTMSSREGESVANSVTTTKITVTVANNSENKSFCIYKGNTRIGSDFNSTHTSGDISLDEGDNTFSVYEYVNSNKTGSALATITVTRATPPPTPTGNEAFTVKGSSDGVFDFDANGGTIQNAPINYTGLNPNATYYLVKSTDTDPDNPRRNPITPSSTGTASSHVDISNGLILYLKIDDGTGKPGETVASMKFSQTSSLVINSSDKPVPAGGSVCSGSNVVVDAQYVGDTYDVNNWSVTGADGLDLECINEGHTLLIKDIKPGDYTVSLTLKNSDVIKTTFNVINSSTLDRKETGCWDEYQVNATPAPTGFTGTWTGDGVSDKNSVQNSGKMDVRQ